MSKEKIFDYINTVKQERQLREEEDSIAESEEFKLRKITENAENCKTFVIGKIIGKLYIDSLPLDDTYKDAHSDELEGEMSDYIKDCGGAEYLQDAIKKTNSGKLQKILETAEKVAHRYAMDKECNVSTISSKDLDYNPTEDDDKDVDDAIETLEFDDISEIVRDNVKNTILSEINRAKQSEERQTVLQNELASDDTVMNDDDIDNRLDTVNESTFYEATLFEALMMKNVSEYIKEGYTDSNAKDSGLNKSTRELTKLNVLSTLMLESYSKQELNNMRDKYLKESL